MATTYQIFADFPDHRVTGRCIYSISDLLTISLLTYLCGGEDYVDMSEFAHVRARDFNLLTDNDTSPSPDTFERLMSAVCPEELRRCLSEHGRSFLSSLGEKQVAIDGKKLRGASPRTTGTRGDYILSAYVTENHLLVGQESVTDKENEIPAIPRLLDRLDIEGAVVSIDAAGTQTAIAERILEGNAHYFLAVKDNQPSLREAVRYAFRCGSVTDTSSEMETGHGRVEERVCRIASADSMEDEAVLSRWPGVRTVVEVTSTVTTPEGAASSVRHYISDEDHPRAAYYAMLARGHWGIENQLHWHLDVTFKEDACRARKGFAAQNLSTVRKLALQIVKAHSDNRRYGKGCSGHHSHRTIFWNCLGALEFDAVALTFTVESSETEEFSVTLQFVTVLAFRARAPQTSGRM